MFRLIRKFRKSLRKEIRNWSNYLLYRYFSTVSAVLKWFRTTSDVAEATSKTGGVSRGKVRLSSLINPLFWIKEFWVFLIRYLYSRNAVAVLLSTPAMLGAIIPGLVVYRWAPGQHAAEPGPQWLLTGSTGGRLLIRRLLPAKIGYFGRKLSGVAVVKVQQLRASR